MLFGIFLRGHCVLFYYTAIYTDESRELRELFADSIRSWKLPDYTAYLGLLLRLARNVLLFSFVRDNFANSAMRKSYRQKYRLIFSDKWIKLIIGVAMFINSKLKTRYYLRTRLKISVFNWSIISAVHSLEPVLLLDFPVSPQPEPDVIYEDERKKQK